MEVLFFLTTLDT